MKEKTRKNPFRNMKVVVRPSPPALKIVLILLILFSILALAALRWVTMGIRSETDTLRKEAAAAEHEKQEIQDKIDALGSVKSVEQIAREELGLMDPDAVILDPQAAETQSPVQPE